MPKTAHDIMSTQSNTPGTNPTNTSQPGQDIGGFWQTLITFLQNNPNLIPPNQQPGQIPQPGYSAPQNPMGAGISVNTIILGVLVIVAVVVVVKLIK